MTNALPRIGLARSLLREPMINPIYKTLETLLLCPSFVGIGQKCSCLENVFSLRLQRQSHDLHPGETYGKPVADLREYLHVEISVSFRKNLDRSASRLRHKERVGIGN